uniref:hypothetical protein n=1 Tax=Falsiroseomonas oryzae TaxID=2766473 RepID=UPI0022EAA2E6
MRYAMAIILGLLLSASASACPLVLEPVAVRLGEDPEEVSGVLLLPHGWTSGDDAAVLAGGGAFRHGCDDPLAAGLLDAGMLLIALDRPAGGDVAPERAASAVTVLREGFGAATVVVFWPAPAQLAASACRPLLDGLGVA